MGPRQPEHEFQSHDLRVVNNSLLRIEAELVTIRKHAPRGSIAWGVFWGIVLVWAFTIAFVAALWLLGFLALLSGAAAAGAGGSGATP